MKEKGVKVMPLLREEGNIYKDPQILTIMRCFLMAEIKDELTRGSLVTHRMSSA
jgi:hypothetical protein